MSWKNRVTLLLLAACCVGPLAGCKPTDKKAPDQPSPSTSASAGTRGSDRLEITWAIRSEAPAPTEPRAQTRCA